MGLGFESDSTMIFSYREGLACPFVQLLIAPGGHWLEMEYLVDPASETRTSKR